MWKSIKAISTLRADKEDAPLRLGTLRGLSTIHSKMASATIQSKARN